jgi:predicted alpha/beta hydrolase family esterase
MKHLLLPGSSVTNREWAEQLKSNLKKAGINLDYIAWEHWDNGKSSFSTKTETEKVLAALKGESEYVILAKSVGVALATKMIVRDQLNPVKLILMGIASANGQVREALKKLDPRNIVIIQNHGDPYNNFTQIKSFVHEINSQIQVIEGERNDHTYPYPEIIISLLSPLHPNKSQEQVSRGASFFLESISRPF